MPSDDRPILIDSNILIYASTPAADLHARALQALDHLEATTTHIWISPQILREFLVHMTRADILGTRTVADVVDQAQRLSQHFRVADESERVRESLSQLVRQFGVQGKQIHDANLVATCVAYGIPRLLTHNVADFHRFSQSVEIVTI